VSIAQTPAWLPKAVNEEFGNGKGWWGKTVSEDSVARVGWSSRKKGYSHISIQR
jgi:hypothetical protein